MHASCEQTNKILVWVSLAGGLVAMAVACGPDLKPESDPADIEAAAKAYAEAVCNGVASCDCVLPYASAEECVSDHVARFKEAALLAVVLDDDCLESTLKPLQDAPCSESLPLASCPSLRGRRGPGEPCSAHPELSYVWAEECQEGLTCQNGKCKTSHEPFPVLPAGAMCWSSSPQSCDGSLTPDVFCTVEGSCEDLQPEGAPCEPFGCESGLYCAGARRETKGSCETRLLIGSACDPLDWLACEPPVSDGYVGVVLCDAFTKTCVEESLPLCMNLIDPLRWR